MSNREPMLSVDLQAAIKLCAIASALVLSLVVGLGMPGLSGFVAHLGRSIPSNRIFDDYVIGVVWATVLGCTIVVWPVNKADKFDLLVLWIIRSFVTLGLMLFAESAYYWDAYGYYALPKEDGYGWIGFGFDAGTENIRQLVWLHDLVLADSYHALKVTWSMLSHIGLYLMYLASIKLLGYRDRRVIYVLMLFPSILFWSSMLGKDAVSLFGMGLYVLGVVSWYKRRAASYLIMAVVGIVIVALVRSWYGPMLVLPLLAFAFADDREGARGRGSISRLFLLVIVVVGIQIALSSSRFGASLESGEALVETTTTISENFARGGSAIESGSYSSVGGLVRSLPFGMFTALFRPLPGEVMNPFGILAGLENALVLAAASLAALRMRLRFIGKPVFLWAMMLIILWAAIYGVTASSNLGAIVRYRLQILPFVLGIICFLLTYGKENNPRSVD